MKPLQAIFAFILTVACVAVCYYYYQDGALTIKWGAMKFWESSDADAYPEPEITIPEGGIKSNELALKCLHLQLLDKEMVNVAFSPLATSMILRQWSDLAAAPQVATIKQLLASNGASAPDAPMGNSPSGIVLPIVDSKLPLLPSSVTDNLATAPFSTDPIQALIDINAWSTVNTDGAIQSPLIAAEINAKTRLISLSSLATDYKWLHPMRKEETSPITFYSADGVRSHVVNTIRTNASLRFIDETTYLAVALFYRATIPDAPPTCLLIIMPKLDQIRDYAKTLTEDQLSAIRTQIASAAPTAADLRMPSFQVHPVTLSQKKLYIQLGLAALFDTTHSLPKLTSEPCQVQDAWQVYSFQAIASKSTSSFTQVPTEAPTTGGKDLSINRPFLWMVTDLTTDAPPQLMGIIEKL